MIVLRKRLIFWLLKAYIKRWGRNILYFFGIGLVIFILLNFAFGYFVTKLPFIEKETIGMVGPYTLDNLPETILEKISRGLTKSLPDGLIVADTVSKWKISPNGKAYAFYLRKDVLFSDGKTLTSDDITYDFSDVSILRPDRHTIVFNLKESYSPFLVSVSRPIFKKGFVGLNDYKVKKIKLNGNFVESLELYSEKNKKALTYVFYPSIDAFKTAFLLGEVSKITDLPDLSIKNTNFDSFKNANVEKKVNYKQLVTLFYNTKDSILSSKTFREGLSYSMPAEFIQGERNSTSLPWFSFASQEGINTYLQDLVHAKELLDRPENSQKKKITLTIQTLSKYEKTAKMIAKIWKKLNIDVKIQKTDKIPTSFQIFLGEFNLSPDPDQYTLWHSDQISNITHYDNKRIDKILEDGRKELDIEKRKQIYADFQKYMFSDPPASFLFFPYYYDVTRK